MTFLETHIYLPLNIIHLFVGILEQPTYSNK